MLVWYAASEIRRQSLLWAWNLPMDAYALRPTGLFSDSSRSTCSETRLSSFRVLLERERMSTLPLKSVRSRASARAFYRSYSASPVT